ncbi:MAG: hypothetical protein J3R72DRAFT_525995 [Linnemannia gamsii]|nr:MAG: hypothetical protein J3R72DRAFT_525995 [Linnemannia gamsii]
MDACPFTGTGIQLFRNRRGVRTTGSQERRQDRIDNNGRASIDYRTTGYQDSWTEVLEPTWAKAAGVPDDVLLGTEGTSSSRCSWMVTDLELKDACVDLVLFAFLKNKPSFKRSVEGMGREVPSQQTPLPPFVFLHFCF